jgi:hypothetical protein
MSLDQIATILKESQLDTETKLFVIDLIALSDNERFVQDVMELILEWKKTDAEAMSTLHDALFALSEEHQARVTALEVKQARTGIEIADRIKTEEKIEKIHQQLLNAI